MRAFAGCCEEHFGRRNHLPAGGVMFTAPELVKTETVELRDQIEIATELQSRLFADGVMGGEECAKSHAAHLGLLMGVIRARHGARLREFGSFDVLLPRVHD
jgi:hypothetical protein